MPPGTWVDPREGTVPMTAKARLRRGLTAAASLLGVTTLSVAHRYALDRPSLSGPILVLDHLFNLLLACALLGLCAAIGRQFVSTAQRFWTRVRFEYDSNIEDLAYSIGIGAGILSTMVLLAGVAGWLRPVPLSVLLVVCCALTWRHVLALPALMSMAVSELASKAGKTTLTLFIAVAAIMIVLALAPPTDWDSLMYHLHIPAQFLERGTVHVPADNLHFSFIGLFHFLYVPLLAAGAPAACALLNVLFGLILSTLMLTAGSRLFSLTTGRLALIVLWGSPVLILGGVTSRVDVVLACYLFLGHYALLRAWREDNTMAWALVAGAILGFAFSIKYLAAAYIAAITPLLLVVAFDRVSSARERSLIVGACSGIAFIASLPWLLKNWVWLGAHSIRSSPETSCRHGWPHCTDPAIYRRRSIRPRCTRWVLFARRSPYAIGSLHLAG